MSINWNFGEQKAIESNSRFTKDADAAFDEFCKMYLNSTNGFFITPDYKPNVADQSSNIQSSISAINILDTLENHYNNEKENFGSFMKEKFNNKGTYIIRSDTKFLESHEDYSLPDIKPREESSKPIEHVLKTLPKNNFNNKSSSTENLFEKSLNFKTHSEAKDYSMENLKGNRDKHKAINNLAFFKNPDEMISNINRAESVIDQVSDGIKQSSDLLMIKNSFEGAPDSKYIHKPSLSNSVYSYDDNNPLGYDSENSVLLIESESLNLKKQLEYPGSTKSKTIEIVDAKQSQVSDLSLKVFASPGISLDNKTCNSLSNERNSDDTSLSAAIHLINYNHGEEVTNNPDLIQNIENNNSKKAKFYQEFFTKPKISYIYEKLDFYDKIKPDTIYESNNENFKSIQENLSPYIVMPTTNNIKKPDGWLGLKVVACGMNKVGRLPIPKANYFIDKGDFGDDAGFWSENAAGDAIGIADGATGNCLLGYDPGDFSRNLMQLCSEFFLKDNKIIDAKSLLLSAYDVVQEKTCYGSSTACVLTLDHTTNIMTAANVGDSGYLLLRNGKIVRKSEPQRITFDCPRQLDSYPWKEKSRKMGVSYTDIIGNETECEQIKVMKDDMIILSSDGLYDNLDDWEIEEICSKSKTFMDAAENLVYKSVKFYRKPDDILVIIAKVVDNKVSALNQRYTKQV